MNKLTSEKTLVKKSNRPAKKGKISITKSNKKMDNDNINIQDMYIEKSLSDLINQDEKGKEIKARFWLFTVYKYNDKMPNGKTKLENLYDIECGINDDVRYIKFQAEIGKETGNKHLQGYIELNNQSRRKKLQEITGCGKHWCKSRKDKDNKRSIAYCCKPNELFPATDPKNDCFDKEANIRYEKGINDVKQGKKSTLSTIVEKIKNGESMLEAIEGNEETYVRNYNGLKNYEHMIDKPRELTDPLEVEVYCGAAGTGKSFKVYNDNKKENIYPVPPSENSKWYPGYDNKKHKVVLYNDFNGSRMKRTTLLELTDIYPTQVEIKGAFVHFKPQKIILTSNDNPLDWYECDENKKWALIRRLTKILEFQYVSDDMEIEEGTQIYKNKDGLEYIIVDKTKEIKDETFKAYKESIKKGNMNKKKKMKIYNEINLELDN